MRDEENEHSLEIELPFVYHLFGSRAKVVLMMVGAVSSSYKSKIAPFLSLSFYLLYHRVLAPFLTDPKTVFVISSDFCHWGYNFDFLYYKDRSKPIWQNIEELDKRGAALIEQQSADAFAEYIEDTDNTICGHNCIEIFLRALAASGLPTTTRMLRYGQSSRAESMADSSVSYCALKTALNAWIVCCSNTRNVVFFEVGTRTVEIHGD